MRDYFEHLNGYINVDDEYLYFTSSGFWKQTEKLQEKKKFMCQLHPITSYILDISCIPAQMFFVILIIWFDLPFWKNIAYVILPILIIYLSPRYIFKLEKDFNYKIPFTKIEYIEQGEKMMKIHFRLADNITTDNVLIYNPSEKSMRIFSKLNLLTRPMH